jgi:hypothetical protein
MFERQSIGGFRALERDRGRLEEEEVFFMGNSGVVTELTC